jgi:hypothetical protein
MRKKVRWAQWLFVNHAQFLWRKLLWSCVAWFVLPTEFLPRSKIFCSHGSHHRALLRFVRPSPFSFCGIEPATGPSPGCVFPRLISVLPSRIFSTRNLFQISLLVSLGARRCLVFGANSTQSFSLVLSRDAVPSFPVTASHLKVFPSRCKGAACSFFAPCEPPGFGPSPRLGRPFFFMVFSPAPGRVPVTTADFRFPFRWSAAIRAGSWPPCTSALAPPLRSASRADFRPAETFLAARSWSFVCCRTWFRPTRHSVAPARIF